MGQSMNRPKHNYSRSRIKLDMSPRHSYRGSSCPSLIVQSKIRSPKKQKQKLVNQQEYTQQPIVPRNEPQKSSIVQQAKKQYGLKPKQIAIQQQQLGGILKETSIVSPNFGQRGQTSTQYGLQQLESLRKPSETSKNNAHHDVTISFSKSKNQMSNPFLSEVDETKQNLSRILQYEQSFDKESNRVAYYVCQQNSASSQLSERKNSKLNQKQKNSNSSKINQSSSKQTIKQATKIDNHDNCKSQASLSHNVSNNLYQNHTYNDYDTIVQPSVKPKKKIVLNKNLMQIKQKIDGKLHDSSLKLALSRSSINDISKSFRSIRNSRSKAYNLSTEYHKKWSLSKNESLNQSTNKKIESKDQKNPSKLLLFSEKQATIVTKNTLGAPSSKVKNLNQSKKTECSMTEWKEKMQKMQKDKTKGVNKHHRGQKQHTSPRFSKTNPLAQSCRQYDFGTNFSPRNAHKVLQQMDLKMKKKQNEAALNHKNTRNSSKKRHKSPLFDQPSFKSRVSPRYQDKHKSPKKISQLICHDIIKSPKNNNNKLILF